jgi:hypothetical protein
MEAVVDKILMQRERARLQAALECYNAVSTNGTSGPVRDHHPSLMQRIANLDSRIALTSDA